jgi:microsomal dipeptidase-like Zn-dependent dipeptidase
MRRSAFRFSAVMLVLLLAGCGHSSAVNKAPTGNGVLPPGAEPKSRYDLANGCYALKSLARATYAVHGADGTYAASSPNTAGAEPFFMKPTALGKYLFYARDRSFLAVSGSNVGSAAAPADAADWTIDSANGSFSVFSAFAGKALTVAADSGKLVLADAASAGDAARFRFDPATGCAEFPEAQVNATGEAFKGRGVDKPALGFADVHQHVSATNFLGGGHYGVPFHRFGITEALKNCEAVHGPNGTLDVIGNVLSGDPTNVHDTIGWPSFLGWPTAKSLSHEQTYYKWIERTWKAGLRILVNNVVENEALCMVENKLPGHDSARGCNEMENAVAQVQTMRDMQDYIDAQEGGPGKGWFRIVTSPSEARQVINDGKLAVVLGIEISHLFNCKLTQVAGQPDVSDCNEAEIDKQLNRLYGLGVREMFPVHEFDNALGGNGIFDDTGILNAGNFVDTKKFWATYDCPTTDPTGNFNDYFFTPGALFVSTDPTGATNPLTEALLAGKGVLPIYPHSRQCNARLLTDLGKYAFTKMMDHKIIMEVDHLELKVKDQLMDMAAARTPPYPVVSTHGGFGGISLVQAKRILSMGGILYPGNGNGKEYVATLNKLRPLQSPNYLFGMGYGADTNGLASQPFARGAGATPVKYPFTLFQGPDWGPQFAGISPVTFDREVTGERTFDINNEGVAQYGQFADFVDEVRIEGGQPALDALFNSAEAYLQMWERTVNR